MAQLALVEPTPFEALEWWLVEGDDVAHAFGPGMRSLCGLRRWTCRAEEATGDDPRCPDCERDGLSEAEARGLWGDK